jgi:hypothetical protein
VWSDRLTILDPNGSRIPAARQAFSTGLSEGISRNITRRELAYITGGFDTQCHNRRFPYTGAVEDD